MGHYADKITTAAYLSFTQDELRILTDALNVYWLHDIKECAVQGPIDEKKREKLRQRLFALVELPPNDLP